MRNFCGLACHYLHYVIYFLAGILLWIMILLIAILSIPAYIYRYVITKVVAPFFRPDIGKAVSVNGNMIASEFLKLRQGPGVPSRCSTVVNIVCDGIIQYDELLKLINTKWVRASTENGQLRYPEFQQYIDCWMGYMFFKRDKNFQLEDHIYLHKLHEDGSEEDAENYLRDLIEELVNKPFPLKQSPWEVHLINNYKNSELDCQVGQPLSVFVIRIHHGLGDGYALLYMIVEALFGNCLKDAQVAKVRPPRESTKQSITRTFNKVTNLIMFPVKLFYDSGYFLSLSFRKRTPWHISDRNKSWRQIYGRSRLIPIEKIKFIKHRFGVTFTSVLVACMSGASAKMMARTMKSLPSHLPYPIAVPIGESKDKWRNQSGGVIFEVPFNPSMNLVSRLRQCERGVQGAKRSTKPFMSMIGLKVFSSQIAPLARYIMRNRYLSTGVTNFPGPGIQIEWNGRKGIAVDFAAGIMNGVGGVGFMVMSYKDHIRICATAENAVLSRDEMTELIDLACQMINELYEIANTYEDDVQIGIENV